MPAGKEGSVTAVTATLAIFSTLTGGTAAAPANGTDAIALLGNIFSSCTARRNNNNNNTHNKFTSHQKRF
jgi:hypothetical protein